MIIELDVDGVLAATHERWYELYNEVYSKRTGIVLPPKYCHTEYSMWTPLKISKCECFDLFEKVWEEPKKVKLIQLSSPEWVNKWTRYAKVHINSNANRDAKIKWLSIHGFEYEEYHSAISFDKTSVHPEIKTETLLFIDDFPSLAEYVEKRANASMRLFDQPWNQELKNSLSVKRIYSLKQMFSWF